MFVVTLSTSIGKRSVTVLQQTVHLSVCLSRLTRQGRVRRRGARSTPTNGRRTDGHTTTAYSTLAYRCAVKGGHVILSKRRLFHDNAKHVNINSESRCLLCTDASFGDLRYVGPHRLFDDCRRHQML